MDTVLALLGITWVGAVISIISIFVAIAATIWSVKKSQREPVPMASMYTRRMVGGAGQELPEEISIAYNAEKVPRIAKTVFMIWNNGSSTLDGNAAVASDPLRLRYHRDTRVLSATVLKLTRKAVAFEASQSPVNKNIVKFSFAFLDPNDGALVEILHTGKGNPTLLGTLKGVPKGVRFPQKSRCRPIFKTWIVATPLLVSGLGLGAILTGIYFHLTSLIITGAAVAFVTTVISRLADRWLTRGRHPKALEEVPSDQVIDQSSPAKAPDNSEVA